MGERESLMKQSKRLTGAPGWNVQTSTFPASISLPQPLRVQRGILGVAMAYLNRRGVLC